MYFSSSGLYGWLEPGSPREPALCQSAPAAGHTETVSEDERGAGADHETHVRAVYSATPARHPRLPAFTVARSDSMTAASVQKPPARRNAHRPGVAPDVVHAPRLAAVWAAALYALTTLLLAYPALAGGFLVNENSDQYIAGYAF